MSKCERMENFLNLSDEELKQVRRKQEVAMLRQEAKFNKVFHSYLKVMKGKEGIVKEMNDLVDVADQKRKRKQALMYEQWTLQVFYDIRQQLQEKLDKMSPDYIKEKLRRFHYQYMDASNNQLIYRDMIFQDYNPFESLQYVIKYSTKGLYDPTMHDLQKEVFEKKFLGEAVKESSAREMLDITKWTYRAFRSTVWGHINADEEDGSEIVVQDLEKWRSHDLMYNTTFLASKYWREEFPRGKMVTILPLLALPCKGNTMCSG
ncbi:hypothetical protein O6H91_08G104300 [Diphasiastrum complanatum]|uniref:Uncharacterized protein n=2 Tax=Diphasiastrum complanatum TaxID=34168 RepID=A0ACC2D0J9_DIPCM|nr:hypothetical protein O6H91_08G104300 [Diphasiastrum complanatum]KAJ7547782.1 hypothetical protein O6H91_08G104300 [Diphasiastrum complanatum]